MKYDKLHLMDWIKQFKLFLFDFDGVLVDTEPLHCEAYKAVCLRRGISWTFNFEQYCKEAHSHAHGIKKALCQQSPQLLYQGVWEQVAEEKKILYTQLIEERSLRLMPGVEHLLEALNSKGITCCVVTNSPKEQVEKIKEFLPVLKSIPHWITREDYRFPKPSPEGYLKAIERYTTWEDRTPSDARIVGFEDTFKGFKALSQTPALPILICPAHREHVSTCLAIAGRHFESFDAIADEAFNNK